MAHNTARSRGIYIVVSAVAFMATSCGGGEEPGGASDGSGMTGGPHAGSATTAVPQAVESGSSGGDVGGDAESAGAAVGTAGAPGGMAAATGDGMRGDAMAGARGADSGGPDAGTTSSDGATTDAGRRMEPTEPTDTGDVAELGSVEDSGADCVIPELPAVDQLTPFAKHHDPFVMLDGSRITTREQWRCRRAEIKAQLERYESGPKPKVDPGHVAAQLSGDTLSITVTDGGASTHFSVNIDKPANAADPAPVLIYFTADTLDSSVFSQNGVATIRFDNGAMGAQSGGGSRGRGQFYDLYGADHPASSMVAWAWGVSRILDALEKTPEAGLDPHRSAVTGCSRHGKGALLAGALDERIALTIPQESGAGGSSSWRVAQAQSQMGENVQTLSNAASEQPWFRASFGRDFGGANVSKLPFDHHMVMGMVAPRALLVIDNEIDWLGIDASYTAGSIAHTIWEAWGLSDRMGYWQTGGHTHCAFPREQRDALDAYVKKFLVGDGDDDTTLLRAQNADADLEYWMEWTPPVLQ